ncbi:hypothetical protein EJ04DRAFT_553344 [Polyplosphaeria fusca]|uniref:Wax synthase domain-containing protein n=1 Tax=Polyplosphaeria fusca TaxID=682080 RepID=A0A9P4V2K5_9PLEO|nr:hypothetical protein EJ04DRAFT_553344 [Polyplosphaeria fusca]
MINQIAVTTHLALIAVQLLFIAAPPFSFRNSFLAGAIVVLVISTHIVGPSSDQVSEAQPYTVLWPIWLATLEKCITARNSNIEDSYWRIDRPEREGNDMLPFAPMKFLWVGAMMANRRLIRWNMQVPNVRPVRTKGTPAANQLPKWRFLVTQIFNLLEMIIGIDVVIQILLRSHAINTDNHGERPFNKVLLGFALGFSEYALQNIMYAAGAILTVLFNLCQPEDWPPLFGKFIDATTVGAFWGKCWHQSIRRPLTTFSNCATNLMGLAPGSALRYYVHVWIAFAISGMMHAQAFALLPLPSNLTRGMVATGTMYFFLWQALVVNAEDLIDRVLRTAGIETSSFGRWKRPIGYCWVVLSLAISLPWVADILMELWGIEQMRSSPTLAGPLLDKVWTKG